MGDIANTILEKYFRTKLSIFFAICIAVLVGIVLYFSIPILIFKIISVLCVSGITIGYIVDAVNYNKLPKNAEGDAVLVRIISKDKEEYEDIKYKFGNEFEKFIKNNECKIRIIYIPYNLVNLYNSDEKEIIIKLLKKTNCIFLTTIKVRSEEVKENIKYIAELNLGIIHPSYEKKIEELFQKEVSILGMPISRLEYDRENKLNILETTARRLSIICKYIIARAYYISAEIDGADRILQPLYNELGNINEKNLDGIKKNVNKMCYDIHIVKAMLENSKKDKNIEIVENELNHANKFIKDTYIYYEGMSVCAFLKNRDIKRVKDCLGNCKRINKNGTWKYSDAFIKAYEGQSEGKIIYHYKQALKIQYNYMDLISFIEDIINIENDKNMLRFALVILYLKLGEVITAKSILKEYLEYDNKICLEENTINQLNKIYEKEILEELFKAE